jgi:hypothetical protein
LPHTSVVHTANGATPHSSIFTRAPHEPVSVSMGAFTGASSASVAANPCAMTRTAAWNFFHAWHCPMTGDVHLITAALSAGHPTTRSWWIAKYYRRLVVKFVHPIHKTSPGLPPDQRAIVTGLLVGTANVKTCQRLAMMGNGEKIRAGLLRGEMQEAFSSAMNFCSLSSGVRSVAAIPPRGLPRK